MTILPLFLIVELNELNLELKNVIFASLSMDIG